MEAIIEQKYELGEDVHDLYRHFLIRLIGIVMKYNKQILAWEQSEKTEIPGLRKRLSVLNERIWNSRKKNSYKQFMQILEKTEQQLSILIDDDRQDDLLLDYNFIKEGNEN